MGSVGYTRDTQVPVTQLASKLLHQLPTLRVTNRFCRESSSSEPAPLGGGEPGWFLWIIVDWDCRRGIHGEGGPV